MDWMQVLVVIACAIFLLYKFGTKNLDYWKKKGIPQTNPLPFVGDSGPTILGNTDGLTYLKNLYNAAKDGIIGMYMFTKPALLVRDPDLLKQIMIKDADHFINRYNWTENTDPFLEKNLSLLRDEKWKTLRTVMTTTFTGAKMKDMFKFMEKCAEQSAENMVIQLKKQSTDKDTDKNILDFEAKEYFSRFGTDVIASTAFGLEVDSFKHPNNEFYEVGKILRQKFLQFPIFKIIFMAMFPKISKFFEMSFFGKEVNDFFLNIINETIRNREENNIVRKDVIHVLMEARKGKGLEDNDESYGKGKIPDLTNADIAAQSMSFFFGGFDIMATALGFICYELAVNPEVQEKLIEEINEVIEYENGVTYDGVMFKMTYLDMVVKEALRKWPPALMTDREVSKPYTLPKSEKTPEVTLLRGDVVIIPIISFHRDPNYYPNPDKFDPERFRDEKNNIKPFTYLPFGAGLRHCIALRYAAMEVKIGLVCLLQKFVIVPTEKTSIPIKLKKSNAFMLTPEKDFWLGLKARI